jgi:hypothetical protein
MPPCKRYGSFYFTFLPTPIYFREVSGKHKNLSVYGGNRFFENRSLGENSKADNPIPINVNDENYNSKQGNLTTVVCATCYKQE